MPTSFRDRLIGGWELIRWGSYNKDDPEDVMYPFGKDCKGTINYTPDGYMSAMLQASKVSSWTAGFMKGTTEEYSDTCTKTLGYSGPFFIDQEEESTAKLIHHMNVSIPPNWIGQNQIRMAEMKEDGGELYLTLRPQIVDDRGDGVQRLQRVEWRKMKDNSKSKPPKADS